jgi:hypothetical protein
MKASPVQAATAAHLSRERQKPGMSLGNVRRIFRWFIGVYLRLKDLFFVLAELIRRARDRREDRLDGGGED